MRSIAATNLSSSRHVALSDGRTTLRALCRPRAYITAGPRWPVTIVVRRRIASPEMLPCADPLPHLICSPPIVIGGGGHGADQYGDTRRTSDCIGDTLCFEQSAGARTDPGRICRREWLAS